MLERDHFLFSDYVAEVTKLSCADLKYKDSCVRDNVLNLVQGFGVHHAMNPDPYRGPFGADGKLYANDLANLLESATPGRIAGFFHETIQVWDIVILLYLLHIHISWH